MVYESRTLTSAEQNNPAHLLQLLAVVHALRVFLSLSAGRRGCLGRLLPDNQAITCLKSNRNLNKMYARWLDKIEDFRFDVARLPGSRNAPRRRPCFVDVRR